MLEAVERCRDNGAMVAPRSHVLWVTLEEPRREGGGGQRRQFFQIRELRNHASVDVIVADPASELGLGVFGRARRRLTRGSVPSVRSTMFGERVRRHVELTRPDHVVVAHIETALVVPQIVTGTSTIVDLHNVYSRYEAACGHGSTARAWRNRESWVQRYASAISVLSEEERLALPTTLGSTIVVPNGVDVEEWPISTAPDSFGLALSASWTHRPNREGLRWFLSSVWSRVLGQVPDATLTLYGSGTPEIGDSPRVRHAGFVSDLAAAVTGHVGIIVPIMRGVGSRVKFIEGLATGRPVVSTSVGAEGYQVPRDLFYLADSPEEFAAACVSVLRGGGRDRAESAREFVIEHYNWSRATKPLRSVLGI